MNSVQIASIKKRLQQEFEQDVPDLTVIEADLAAFVTALELDGATEDDAPAITMEVQWLQQTIKKIEERQTQTMDELKQLTKSKKNIKHYQTP